MKHKCGSLRLTFAEVIGRVKVWVMKGFLLSNQEKPMKKSNVKKAAKKPAKKDNKPKK